MGSIDYAGLTTTFTRYYRRLVSYAVRYVESIEEARDIVQDSFVKIWEQKEQYSDSRLASLLFRTVRNACLDSIRHRIVESKFSSEMLSVTSEEERIFNIDFLGAPQGMDLYSTLSQEIGAAVSKLPERKREVFELSHYEGLSNKEIAARLGISEAAVSKHLSSAVAKLSKSLIKKQ